MYRVARVMGEKLVDVVGYDMKLDDARQYLNMCVGNYPTNTYVITSQIA